MTLRQYWFSLSRPEQVEFLARVGTTKAHFAALRVGLKRPGPEMARKLFDASGGRVPLHVMRPDIWPENEAA